MLCLAVAALAGPPAEDEPCHWRVYCHPSHNLTYEFSGSMDECDQPQVINMRHHPTDPCDFKIVFGAGATYYEDRQSTFPIGECNAPIVVLAS